MQYLVWRVLVGLNQSITISFLVVGHTKFLPDWCFGLLKQKFRKSKVDCLADLVKVVEESAEVSHAQLVDNESGDVFVPTYNWADHFDTCFRQTALKGIKSIHHFHFSGSQPGWFLCKKSVMGRRGKSNCSTTLHGNLCLLNSHNFSGWTVT